MLQRVIQSLPSRVTSACLISLMFTTLACYHRRATSAQPPAPAGAQVGQGEGSATSARDGQSLSANELDHIKAKSVEELLEGRFPGVEVIRTRSGGFKVLIRGGNTILGESQPLYVVNGVAVQPDPERGLDWLNPADIERIEVVKDAAQLAFYGMRGGNGVILIKTK